MSYLKLNPDLFLGSQELNRFKKFLDDDGFRKILLQNSLSFGVINNSKSGNFDSFRVEQGTNVGTIKHALGLALNKNGLFISKPATDNIALTNDNLWYWVKIKHQYSPIELGTVSVDVNGTLTGSGTEFLSILRGQPNNPVKIKFSGSASNTGEYGVVEVVSNTTAILAGDFTAESSLQLIVVGAFTPDVVPPSDSKDIFQYDSCLMTLVAESVSNTPPTLLADEEFVIARVRRNGAVISIEDKRYALYKSRPEHQLTRIAGATNPLIGIEAIKFDSNLKPRDTNLVYLAWTFRSTNWTIDSAANRLTLIAGNGGKFKDTTYFTNGDFDGWRVYAKNSAGVTTWSHYAIVKASSKSGSQINLILDYLDPDQFIDTAQEIIVAPDADTIEIFFTPHPADATELTTLSYFSKINEGLVRIPVTVYKSTSCTYNVKYRLNTFGDYRKPTPIPTDTVSGYLIESDFDTAGVQTASVRQTYTSHETNGFITLQLASNAYTNRIGSIETGDLFGIEHLILTNVSPIVDYTVGLKKQYQVVETKALIDGGQGNPFVLTVDHFINLKKIGVTNLKGGNTFIFQFKGDFTLGAFDIIFTQDYVNSGDTGTNLYTITAYDVQQSILDNVLFRCIYDDVTAQWIVYRMIHKQSDVDISVKADKSIVLTAGNGLSGGGDLSAARSFAVNVDGTSVEINADTVRLPGGYKAVQSPDGVRILTKALAFSGWNMDTTATKDTNHGITSGRTKIINAIAYILSGTESYPLNMSDIAASGNMQGWVKHWDDTEVRMVRLTGGSFDDAAFNAASGVILIFYIE